MFVFFFSLLFVRCIVVGRVLKIIIGKGKKKLFRRWLFKYLGYFLGNEFILSEISVWNNNVRGKENEKFLLK